MYRAIVRAPISHRAFQAPPEIFYNDEELRPQMYHRADMRRLTWTLKPLGGG